MIVVSYMAAMGSNVSLSLYVASLIEKLYIINESKKRNIEIHILTDEVTKTYHNNLKDLNVLSPGIEPKVTENIDEIITVISSLIEKGYAYEADGNVYFDVSKYDEYGRLSYQKKDALL